MDHASLKVGDAETHRLRPFRVRRAESETEGEVYACIWVGNPEAAGEGSA